MAGLENGYAGREAITMATEHIIEHHDIGVFEEDFRHLVDVTDPQRWAELQEALRRALNCWEKRPAWLVALYYELQMERTDGQKRTDQQPAVVPQQVESA